VDKHTIAVTTPLEKLLVEKALAYAQELQRTANAAPDGEVLARCEALVLAQGREFLRESLQATLQQQANDVQQKGGRPAPVHAARRTGTRAPRPTRS